MINIEDLAIQIQEAVHNAYDNGHKQGEIYALKAFNRALIMIQPLLCDLDAQQLFKMITNELLPGAISKALEKHIRGDVGNGHGK